MTWYKWYCPEDHFQLLTEEEQLGKKEIYCERCSKSYFISSGTCGEKYESEDHFSFLHG